MAESKENWVNTATYRQVAKDLIKLSHSMKSEEKAVKAHNLAQKIQSYSENNPAPERVQAQINNFVRKRNMYVAKQKNEQKSQSQSIGI